MQPITNQTVAQHLIDYMNGDLTLTALVAWAESTLMDTPLADAVAHDVLAYIGAADVEGFPLGWGDCHDLLVKLGTPIRVAIVEP